MSPLAAAIAVVATAIDGEFEDMGRRSRKGGMRPFGPV